MKGKRATEAKVAPSVGSDGGGGVVLICRSKSVPEMTTAEVVSDFVILLAELFFRAQKRADREAIKNLYHAGSEISRLLERIEEIDSTLLDFLQGVSGMPVYLSGKKEVVKRAVERLHRLGVGTRSTVPTYSGTAIDADNFFTKIATEIHSRLRAYRDYIRLTRNTHARQQDGVLPPSLVPSAIEVGLEIWPPPKGCSSCWRLDDLSAANWSEWWKYGERVLADLWNQKPELYQQCIALDSAAGEAKDSRESVRRNYAKKNIRQAFEGIAKNIIPPSLV